MIVVLRVIFGLILIGMLAVTTVASLDRGVFEAGVELWPDPWFKATLADAYFGFLVVWLWIAYKEGGWIRPAIWALLLAGFGNIAIAVYMLIELFRLRADDPIEKLLIRKAAQ